MKGSHMLPSNKNKSWRNQQKVVKGLITILAIAWALSTAANFVQSSKLKKERKNIETLKPNKAYAEQISQTVSNTIERLQAENESLRTYVNTAHRFVLGIEPSLSENDSSCEKTNCPDCKAIKEANKVELEKYNRAIKTLGIDPILLQTLRQGPQNK